MMYSTLYRFETRHFFQTIFLFYPIPHAHSLIYLKMDLDHQISFKDKTLSNGDHFESIYQQVTLVATTRLTLNWTPSKHHLLLLAGFCSENYRWTYTHIQKNCIIFANDDYFVKRLGLSVFLSRFSKVNRKRQLAVGRRCPYEPPLPTVQFCV